MNDRSRVAGVGRPAADAKVWYYSQLFRSQAAAVCFRVLSWPTSLHLLGYVIHPVAPSRRSSRPSFYFAAEAQAVTHDPCDECKPPAVQAAFFREIFGNPWRPVKTSYVALAAAEMSAALAAAEMSAAALECGAVEEKVSVPWLTPTVLEIAKSIYDNEDWGVMPILGDALEDAGCDNEYVLRHCRGQERCIFCRGTGEEHFIADRVGDSLRHERWRVPLASVCMDCNGTGWRTLRGPHVRGCWVVDLILGKNA